MRLTPPPLLAALLRNPTGAILVIAQIAITLAVLCNAASIVAKALARIDRPTGIDARNTFVIAVKRVSKQFHIGSAEREDLAYLRGLPGVVAATVTLGVPLSRSGLFIQFGRTPNSNTVLTPFLPVDEHALQTLGVPLLAGRNFRADEIAPYSSTDTHQNVGEIIVTKALAHALFPNGHALGATVYEGRSPATIIGITRNFMGPQVGSPAYEVALVPAMTGNFGIYFLLVRTRPGHRNAVLRVARRHIADAHVHAVVAFAETLAKVRRHLNAANRNMAIFLSSVTALMLAVCCLGVFGLSAFNVSRRVKQIGIRRAVGARKRDIVRQFVAESGLILAAGIVLGSFLALALGEWLSDHYGEPRLNLLFLMASIVTLWCVGQLAAWQPARRAANVPPSVATRTI